MSDVEIRVRCVCGAVLTVAKRETEPMYSNLLTLTVEPCLDCGDEKYDEGFEDGQDSLDEGIDQ